MTPLLLAAIGLIVLIVTRITSGGDPITRRAYGKLYAGAPGANTENKPDGG